jgi:hypothetical protein
MATDKNTQKLVDLLEKRAWNPILRASPEKYNEADRKALDRVKKKTEAQRERYRNYGTAGEIRQQFQDDLRSPAARRTNADLRKLNLPVQADVADEFLSLADRLGVRAERRAQRTHQPHPWHKSKPQAKKSAKRALTKQARKGDKAAIKTLKNAPRAWARDYAKKLQTGASSKAKKRTRAR